MKAQIFLDSKRLPIFHHPLSRSTGNLHITHTSYPSYDHEDQNPNLLSPHYQNPITHPTPSRSPARAYDNPSSPKRIPSDRSENGGLNFQVLEEIIFSLTPPNVIRNVRPSSCREFSRALDKLKEEADPIIFIDQGSTPVSPTRRFSYGSLSEINKLSEKYSVGSYDPVLRSPIIEESSDEVFDYSNKVDGKARRGSGKSLKSLYVPGGVIPEVPDGVTVTKEECIVPEDFLGVSKDYEQPRRPKKEDHRARKPEFERSYEKRPCLKKAQSTQSIHNLGISHFRTQSSPEPKRSPHTDPEIPSVAYLSKRRVTDTGFLIPSRTTSTLDLRSNGYTKISTIKPKSKSWKNKVGQFFPAMHDRSSAKEKDKRRDSREFYGISPAYAGSIPCLVRQQTTRWKSFVGLPDDLASVLKSEHSSVRAREPSDRSPITPNHFVEDDVFFAKISQPPQLEKSKWMDLELWSVEDPSWTAKHPNIKLSTNEKKRQNIINEFYYTEKQHCQMIVFLQQAYQVGLRSLNVLSENELNQLIPDVLDSMLDFHLRLLRKIRRRKADNIVVDKISDIICEEFENGPYTTAAINAYTSFCASREESQKRYLNYLTKSPRFKQFFELQEQNPCAKGRTFKACLLVIASRLTKYPVLVEQIGKYDPPEHKEENKRAHYAVKQFALKVDRELSKIELNRRWDHLRQNLDVTSTGRLLKEPFTIKDLVYQDPADCRKVVSIGSVKMQDVKTGQKVELCMVLFDDIIVLFQDKNGTLQFFKHSDHASVIPLQTLIPREMERSNEIMLVVTAKECPDMYRLIFNNKSEVRQWIQAIKSARETAPRYVRRHGHTQNVESANQMGSENDPNEIAYNENIQKWQKGLEGIFALRKDKEEQLRVYINERMKFFDEVRSHFKKFPAKPIKDPHLIAGTSRAKIERQNRDIEKMKNIVREKFNELREHRRAALDQLVETAQNARDCDLVSFFDDLHDLSHPENQATSSTSSEENDESRGYRQKKPKRNRTYHGEVDSYEKGSIRRHTTLPKMGEAGPNSPGEEDAETEKQVDEEYRKLPLKMSSKARRAASKLIEENVSLRVENNKLKSEIALQELHIVSLKSRKAPVVETAEKLESLRQKQEEIRELEKRFKQEREMHLSEISLRQKELENKEALLKSNEANLNKRWHDLLNMEEKQSLNTAHTISPQASFKDGSIVQREKSSPRTSTIYPSLSGSDLHAPIPHHLAEKSKKMIKKDKK